MKEEANKISVIIPTFNRLHTLEDTFESIKKSSYFPNEVLVMDQTVDAEKQYRIKELCEEQPFCVLYHHLNFPSSTHSRNKGIELAKHEIIVFMDDDVSVSSTTFSSVLDLMKDQKVGMLGGIDKQLPTKNSVLGTLFFKSNPLKKKVGHITPAIYGRFPLFQNKEQYRTEWAMGFFFVVRKSLLMKWNLRFDENLLYYAYAEDLDFSYRYFRACKKEDLKCFMSTRLIVDHQVSHEYRMPSKSNVYQVILHREYLRHKFNKGICSFFASRIADIGDIFYRCMRRESIKDIISANYFLLRYKSDIHAGNFHYELFIKNN